MSHVKQCPQCQQDKPIGEFAESQLNADGLTIFCNQCRGTDEPITCHLRLSIKTFDREYEIAAISVENDDTFYISRMVDRIIKDPEYKRLMLKFAKMLLELCEGEQ